MTARDAFHTVFYHGVVSFLKFVLCFGSRVRFLEFGQIPPGACVMVSNHISHFDPPFLSGWLPRKIDWIAMAELFGAAWSKAAFTWLDVIPVDRHGDDRQALRHALRRLEQGRMIGVFPEGGIRDGERSILAGADMREGAFLIAAKAGCPVVPVVILGSERLYNRRNWLPWRRAKVFIGVGEPVFSSPDGGRKKLRDDVAAALIALKNRLVAECHLTPDDLPHSPQERMREP
ncbi:MAG: lysophospholipid acyltransferase family protein [Spartobacteria bacterium]